MQKQLATILLATLLIGARSGPQAQGSETSPNGQRFSDDVVSVPVQTRWSPLYQGTTFTVGGTSIEYVGPEYLTSGGGGPTASISYWSEECQEQVVVTYQQMSGQSLSTMLAHFQSAVRMAQWECAPALTAGPTLALFSWTASSSPAEQAAMAAVAGMFVDLAEPGVVEESTGAPGVHQKTMSLSWFHDPDLNTETGTNGPLKPVKVEAKVEVDPGQSVQSARNEPKNLVTQMMSTWPPNV